jgi:hypothetical protein
MYIARNKNIVGSVLSTRYTLFFYDWDIGAETGTKIISLNRTIQLHSSYYGYEKPSGTDVFGIYMLTDGYNGQSPATNVYVTDAYSISVVAVNHWRNNILVTTEAGVNKITLTRNVSGVKSASTITAGTWYNYDVTDLIWHIPPDQMTNVTITNIWGKKYIFPIRDSGDLDLTAPATISVRSTQNGALIPGATATILDSQTGTTLVNDPLATGTGTFSLEKSHTLRYLASATADGYTLLSPIQFDTGDSGVSIVLWMSPTGAPTPPENTTEGKTMLYGYLITAGSSQPIPWDHQHHNGYEALQRSALDPTSSTTSIRHYTISASARSTTPSQNPSLAEITATPHKLALKGH